jgi:L-fucose isomerase-like protein
MYFPLGGGTLKGIGRPGKVVWSRVFVEGGRLHVDLGLGSVVELSAQETTRRWSQTTPQWPMVSACFDGVSRDSFMARHRANHVNIAYASDAASVRKALAVKSAMFHALGVQVHLCGTVGFE